MTSTTPTKRARPRPQYKIYDHHDTYQAATKECQAAAALVAFYGYGATIKWGHDNIVWREGRESQSAWESYDYVAEVAAQRIQTISQRAKDRVEGEHLLG